MEIGALTKHFRLSEFRSHDGAPTPPTIALALQLTAEMLESLREALSKDVGRECPLLIVSGYRSPAWNKAVGGVSNSYHLKGLAADVTSPYASPARVQKVARRLQARGIVGGLGSYPGFTHVDRGPKRSWSPTTRLARAGPPKGG